MEEHLHEDDRVITEDRTNSDLVRRACIALRKHDLATVYEVLDDAVSFRVPGRSLIAGSYLGRAAVLEFYERRLELSGGSFRSSIHDIVANRRHAFAIERSIATRNGDTLDSFDATMFHIVDGKIAGAFVHVSEQYRHDEFWS